MLVKCVQYLTGERYFTLGNVYEVDDVKRTMKCDNGFVYTGLVGDPDSWGLSNWYKFAVVPSADREIKISYDDFLKGK